MTREDGDGVRVEHESVLVFLFFLCGVLTVGRAGLDLVGVSDVCVFVGVISHIKPPFDPGSIAEYPQSKLPPMVKSG